MSARDDAGGESHSADVVAVHEGLARLRFTVVDDLPIDSVSGERSTRVEFAPASGANGVGAALVVTRGDGSSRVRGLPMVGRTALTPRDFARLLAGVDRSRFSLDAPTNDEVRSVLDRREAVGSERVRALRAALEESSGHEIGAALAHPGWAGRTYFDAAEALLVDLSSGAPVEWCLRRARAGAGS